jgi:hypothetical protein
VRVPVVRERVTLNVVSMMAGGCAGDEKPREATGRRTGDQKRKEKAGSNGCCLFRGVMIVVRRDDMQTQHALS